MKEQLKAEVAELNKSVQQNTMPLAQAEGQVLAKEEAIHQLEDQEREGKIRSQIDQLKQEIKDLNIAVQQHKTSLAKAEGEVLAKEEEIYKLEAKLSRKPVEEVKEEEKVKEEVKIEEKPPVVEKYLDIDPAKIKEVLNPEELSRLKGLQEKYWQAQTDLKIARLKNEPTEELQKRLDDIQSQIDTFFKVNLKDILSHTQNQDALSEEEITQAAQKIKQIIEETVELEATREMAALSKKLGPMAQKMLKNSLVMAGTSVAVAGLGITGFGGVITLAGATTLVRHLMQRRQKSPNVQSKASQKFEQNLSQAKVQVLDNLFADVELLRRKMSGHISNVLRQETSERALADLASHEQTEEPNNLEFAQKLQKESDYRNYREVYLRALTKIKAEYPNEDLEQQKKRAITLAAILTEHRRQDQATVDELTKLQANQPAVFGLIEKYGLMMSGQSKENEKDKEQARFLYSLGLGTAAGVAIRSSGLFRVISGAAAGTGAGKAFSENFDSEQNRLFKELEKMLDEVERSLVDIEFPVENLETFKRQRLHVESRLEMELLDANPLLKSRAENFVHQVQKLEMLNAQNIGDILGNINENTLAKEKLKQENLKRLESKIKQRRWLYIVGGGILGGAAAWALGELGGRHDAKADTMPQTDGDFHAAQAESTHIPMGDIKEAPLGTKEAMPTHFEDTIQSHDSIWASTKNIFEQNHEKLGYTGDPNDTRALDAWAERQTANAVNDMRFEQGGNLADLVHEGDKVTIDLVDGHAKLHFEASSGIEPGHLDGGTQMHAPESVGSATETSAPAVEAVADQVKAPDTFHQVLASQDKAQIDNYVQDYFKAHNLPEDKRQVFLALMHNTPDLAKYDGSMDDLVKNFDSHVRTSFDEIKNGPKYHWMGAKIGDHYVLVKSIDGRWGLAGYQIDTNGDGLPDKTISSNVALREALTKGRF